jgi:hypothetical protein
MLKSDAGAKARTTFQYRHIERISAMVQQMDREQHAARASTDDQNVDRHVRIERDD